MKRKKKKQPKKKTKEFKILRVKNILDLGEVKNWAVEATLGLG